MENKQEQSTTSDNASATRRVIVFARDLLPLSETFVREQARTLQAWHPILVGERLVPNGLPLDGLDTCLLCPRNESRLRRWSYVLCRILGIPHLPSVWRLRKLKASLIHAHFGTNAVDFWPIARALSLPMLVTLHGFDINTKREWWESGKNGWQRRNYPRKLLEMAQDPGVSFIAVSDVIRKRAIDIGIPPQKIALHYIGVDVEKFTPPNALVPPHKKTILFVGRLVENKGVRYLIEAYSKIFREIPESQLAIVGDGPLRDDLLKLSLDIKVPVTFYGAETNISVLQRMRAAHVFCLPSVTIETGESEAFGLVLLEAQACGVPVISSARGGSKEGLIDSVTGFRVEERDVNAIAFHLKALLTNQQLHSEFSTKAIVFVRENFSLKDCSRRMENIYASLKRASGS